MKINRMRGTASGFTLIELLVVVAIVGVLSTIVFASLSAAREKARIARAKQDVGQIMRAAELVYNEYGYYPNDSHGSIICPKDIIIHELSGRLWGDFVGICEGAWGSPLEWNNQCGNGALRKPHAPYDPTCASFSDADPGPVGIVVLGPNGVNDGCTEDDLCIGNRGHPIYGWDGQVTQGGGGGPMCTTSISDCASLSPLGCISRTGCTLGDYGCTGSYDNSCNGFADQTSCQAEPTCSWSSGGCGGTATTCDTYGDSISCGTASGCSWTSGSSSCGGTAGSCSLANYGDQTSCEGVGCSWGSGGSCAGTVSCSSYNSDQTTCQASGCSFASASCGGSYTCSQWNGTNATTCTTNHPGCTWVTSGGGKCNGGTLSCSSFSQSLCTPTGCSWSSTSCVGSPSCGVFSEPSCTPSGCSWSVSNTCSGSPNSCANYGSSGTCSSALGCSWNTGSSFCSGSADCSYGDSSSCSAVGCTWGTSSCQGTFSTTCAGLSDQTSCQAEPTCSWSSGTCTGSAISCTTIGDETSCSSQSGCSWQ